MFRDRRVLWLALPAVAVALIAISLVFAGRVSTPSSTPTTATGNSSATPELSGPPQVARDSVVLVSVINEGRAQFEIAGVLVGDSRYVLGSLSPLASGTTYRVRPSSRGDNSVSAQLVSFNESMNLGVLRLESPMGKHVPLFAMLDARTGDAVQLIAFPFVSDSLPTITPGRVERIDVGTGTVPTWITTSAALPANGSGGIVVDDQGRLLGIATRRPGAAAGDGPSIVSTYRAVTFLTAALSLTVAVQPPAAVVAAAPLAPTPSSSTSGVLPYLAYGSGLRAGQVIEARRGSAVIARAVADGDGNWSMRILGGQATPGERLTLTLDGAATSASFAYAPGQFPAPPGFVLR